VTSDRFAPITFRPIGVIRSPFTTTEGMPIQAASAGGVRGTIELDPSLADGLLDLAGFSHVTLVYHLHEVVAPQLVVTPFLDTARHGIFATRSPARPNPIGVSTVRLVRISGTTLEIEDVDVLDGTPLLDLKPYVPAFDDRAGAAIGWFASRLDRLPGTRSDDRFAAAPRGGSPGEA
jgi:tRNA (adenine37-N6)-methyltransferase